MSIQKILEKETYYHDACAENISINDSTLKYLSGFDSPASYIADRIPRLKRELLQAIGDPGGKRVLVYGCGNDSAALWFSRSGAKVDAIDISPKSVENQRMIATQLNLDINAMIMDAHRLDLPSDTYDIVYGNAILHHLELQAASQEIARVLKPDGTAVFRDVQSGNIFLRAFRAVTPFWRTPDEHPLKSDDLAMFVRKFSTSRNTQYMLSSLPYSFFARIAYEIICKRLKLNLPILYHSSIFAAFDRIDEALFHVAPALKTQAWLCLIICTK